MSASVDHHSPASERGVDVAEGEYTDITRSMANHDLRGRWPFWTRALVCLFWYAIIAYELIEILGGTADVFTWVQICFWFALSMWVWTPYGEPHARFRRVYAARGRVDVVWFGSWVRAFTRAECTLEPPTKKQPSYVIRTEDNKALHLLVTQRDAPVLEHLWNQPTIAPPYGAGD